MAKEPEIITVVKAKRSIFDYFKPKKKRADKKPKPKKLPKATVFIETKKVSPAISKEAPLSTKVVSNPVQPPQPTKKTNVSKKAKAKDNTLPKAVPKLEKVKTLSTTQNVAPRTDGIVVGHIKPVSKLPVIVVTLFILFVMFSILIYLVIQNTIS